jgi:hypothetical protein
MTKCLRRPQLTFPWQTAGQDQVIAASHFQHTALCYLIQVAWNNIYTVKFRPLCYRYRLLRLVEQTCKRPGGVQCKDNGTCRLHLSGEQFHINIQIVIHMDIAFTYPWSRVALCCALYKSLPRTVRHPSYLTYTITESDSGIVPMNAMKSDNHSILVRTDMRPESCEKYRTW